MPDKFNVWEGVYGSFGDAPIVGPGFDGPEWRARSSSAALQAHAEIRAGESLDYSMRQRNSVLVTLAAALLAQKPRIRILDFGGGPGYGFLVLQAAIPNAAERIEYQVVEVENVCVEASRMFEGAHTPTFRSTLPDDGDFDIVFTASALQYIEEWRAICQRLAAYRAPFLVFADVFAGPIAAYVTLQSYYGSKIAHWMLNEAEFVGEVLSAGYRLQLKTACNVKVLGSTGDLPMSNLPAEARLKNTNHFMFSASR